MTVKELIQELLPYQEENADRIVVINSTDDARNDRIVKSVYIYEEDIVIEGTFGAFTI